jgi:hypothetical protein
MAKGGRETQEVILPEFFETPVQQQLGMAADLVPLQSTYIPDTGIQVAALSPQEQLSNQYTDMAAQSFGMPTVDTSSYLPPVQNMGGIQGYSSAPMTEQMIGDIPQPIRDYAESFGIAPDGTIGERAPQNQPVALEMQGGSRGK